LILISNTNFATILWPVIAKHFEENSLIFKDEYAPVLQF